MQISKEDVLRVIRSFSKSLERCDQTVLELCRTMEQLERHHADTEKIMTATFHSTWKVGEGAGRTPVLRDVSDIYAESLAQSERELKETAAMIAQQTRKRELLCRIRRYYLALPEKEKQILSVLYEDRPVQETYAARLERAEDVTGFSRSHIARLARRGIQRIQENCQKRPDETK